MLKLPRVHHTTGGWFGLGDCWLFLSVLAWRYGQAKHPVYVWGGSSTRRQSLPELWKHLDVKAPLVPVACKPRVSQPYLLAFIHTYRWLTHSPYSVFGYESYPTRARWEPEEDRLAVQYDGISYPDKNFTPEDRSYLEKRLGDQGLGVMDLSYRWLDLGLKIEAMRKCAGFVGVPSGMSFVALSLGMPTHVIANGLSFDYVQWLYRKQPKARLYPNYRAFLARDCPVLV